MRKMSEWLDGIQRLKSIPSTGTLLCPSAPGDR